MLPECVCLCVSVCVCARLRLCVSVSGQSVSLHCNESELQREKEVIVGLLSYRAGALWEEEERAEWRRREGGGGRRREKQAWDGETAAGVGARTMSASATFLDVQPPPKKNPLLCGKCLFLFFFF